MGGQLDRSILREYDIRGIVDRSLAPADVATVGRAFGTIVAEQGGGTVVLGRDGRLSSPKLADAMAEGLLACGLDVVRIGCGPTPMLYYASSEMNADAAVQITGSHNPPEYNGIKMVLKNKPFFGRAIQRVGEIAASGRFASGRGRLTDRDVIEPYIARLLKDFTPGKALRVAWDAGNGSAGDAMRRLTERLPGRHILLNAEIDGRFPNHHPDPTEEKNLEQLKQAVLAEGCDLGIAFDGDGDRIGVVDGKARVLWGDQILVVLARDVLADLPGATIIADVKASQVFFDEIARMGGKPLMGKTGHSLIKNMMAETGAALAGEMSGHIFFKHRWYGFDDALYSAVRLLAIAGSAGQSLAEMRDSLPTFVNTPELRFDCPEDRKFQAVAEVKARLADESDIKVDDIDGVRVTTEDGWWLLRASNTQAVLVARCEARTEEGLARLKALLSGQLQAVGLNPPDLG